MRWLLAAVRAIGTVVRGLWRWVVVRKVLVQDTDATPVQQYVEDPVLTGTETEQGRVYRGDEDPADTPAILAVLEPGDLWIDTTGGQPFQHKVRNATNDGWDWSQLVAKDGAGVILTAVLINDTTISLSAGLGFATVETDGRIRLANDEGSVVLGPDGVITLQKGVDGSKVKIALDGAIELANAAAFSSVILAADGTLNIAAANINLLPDVSLTSNTEVIGTRAAAVADVVGSDPADIATTLNALLASLRNSNELAT